MRSDLESEHKLTLTPAVSGMRNFSKPLQKLQSVYIEEAKVLNEALAKEVERNVRRSEEFGSTPGELAVPREVKETHIPPDSDPRKRRAMKAATVAAINNSSQMEGSCVVAKTSTQQNSVASGSRKDVEEEERDESRSSNA